MCLYQYYVNYKNTLTKVTLKGAKSKPHRENNHYFTILLCNNHYANKNTSFSQLNY